MARFRSERSRQWVPALVLTIGFLATACPGASTPEGEGGAAETGAGDTGAEVANPGVLIHALGGEPRGSTRPAGRGWARLTRDHPVLRVPRRHPTQAPRWSRGSRPRSRRRRTASSRRTASPIRSRSARAWSSTTAPSSLTADDVLFSWDRAMTMDLPRARRSSCPRRSRTCGSSTASPSRSPSSSLRRCSSEPSCTRRPRRS